MSSPTISRILPVADLACGVLMIRRCVTRAGLLTAMLVACWSPSGANAQSVAVWGDFEINSRNFSDPRNWIPEIVPSSDTTALVLGYRGEMNFLGTAGMNTGTLTIGDFVNDDGGRVVSDIVLQPSSPGVAGALTIHSGFSLINSSTATLRGNGTSPLTIRDRGSISTVGGTLAVEPGATFIGEQQMFVAGRLIVRGGEVDVNRITTTRPLDDGVVFLDGGILRAQSVNSTNLVFEAGELHVTGSAGLDLSVFPGNALQLGDGTKLTVNQTLDLGSGSLRLFGGSLEVGDLEVGNGVIHGNRLNLTRSQVTSGRMRINGGSVLTTIRGDADTVIESYGFRSVTLGDLSSFVSFDFQGTLIVSRDVLLLDRDHAELGILTTIAEDGRLSSVHGIALGAGETLDAASNSVIDGAFINDGMVNGPSDGFVTFVDDVTGAGDFTGNVLFSDAFSPGNSPGLVSLENLEFDNSAQLVIELGGTAAGVEHDQLLINGNAALGGTLALSLLDDFTPSPGDQFEILDLAGTLTGKFTGLDDGALLSMSAGAPLRISYTGGDGNDVVLTAVPEPGTLLLALAVTSFVGIRRRGFMG